MKQAPPEKVAEAFSALADERVRLFDGYATVISSDRAKEYTVTWNGNVYTSNDSATYWQGYPGYPVIAVLLARGVLTFNPENAAWFSGINWTELNARHKRDYAAALAEVLKGIAERGGDPEKLSLAMDTVYQELNMLPLALKRGKARPASRAERPGTAPPQFRFKFTPSLTQGHRPPPWRAVRNRTPPIFSSLCRPFQRTHVFPPKHRLQVLL